MKILKVFGYIFNVVLQIALAFIGLCVAVVSAVVRFVMSAR